MGFNYGLSNNDLIECRKKLSKQKDYLESHSFITSSTDKTGEVKSLLDLSYSANLSTRYYARILNKVHTFVSLNVSRNYMPVFLTVTLDGFFRDFLKGDYTRFTDDLRQKYEKHIPNNDRNGKYWDYINTGLYSNLQTKKTYGVKLTARDLYKILSHQLHRFIRSGTLQDIRKNGDDYSFIRVTEPHKDGTPHFHILMYIPEKYLSAVYNEFEKFFPAPRNHAVKNDAAIMFGDQKETYGFQTEIHAAGGYILKYILKSFRNLMEEKELDYLQAWYVHNRIPRIITTHTLISQKVYHHLSLLDDDWFYMTTIKLKDYCKIDNKMNIYHLRSHSNRELIYTNGLYQLFNNGVIVKQFGENKLFGYKFTLDCPVKKPFIPNIPVSLTDRFWLLRKRKYRYKFNQPDNIVEVELPDYKFILYDKLTGQYGQKRDFLPVTSLSDLDLFDWFYNYDFDLYGAKRFALIKRTMIERGLLEFEEVNFDDYNFDFKGD